MTRFSRALSATIAVAALSLSACAAEDSGTSAATSSAGSETSAGSATGSESPQAAVDKFELLRVYAPTTMAFGAPMAGFGTEGFIDGVAEDVEKTNWDSVDQLRSAIINGEVELAAAPANVGANLYNRGVDVRYVGPVVWGMLYVLGDGAEGTPGDWEALRGQRIAVPLPGNMPDLVFTHLLNKNGLTEEDVEIIRVADAQQAMGLFGQGEADFVVLPEHGVTMAETQFGQQGKQTHRALDLQEEYAEVYGTEARFPMAGLIMPGEVVDENPELVEAVRQEVAATIEKANAGDEATIAAIAEHYSLPPEIVEQVIPRLQLEMAPASEVQEEFEQFLTALGESNPEIYGGRLPDDGFYLD